MNLHFIFLLSLVLHFNDINRLNQFRVKITSFNISVPKTCALWFLDIKIIKIHFSLYSIPNLGRRCSSPHLPLKLVDLFSTSYLNPIDLKFWEWLEEG